MLGILTAHIPAQFRRNIGHMHQNKPCLQKKIFTIHSKEKSPSEEGDAVAFRFGPFRPFVHY